MTPMTPTTQGGSRLGWKLGPALLALGVAGALSACGGSSSSSATLAAASTRPVEGGTISYGHEQEPPCLTGGWVQQAYISRQFLDSLVSQVGEGEIVPWLATSWSVSKDQRTWTFKLREGVRFHDGTPLDASAVAYNFDYWLNPRTANGTVAAYIGEYYAGSRAVDDHTFQLNLTKPYSPLLSALSQAYFGIQSPTALKRGVEVNCEQPVGSGPFVVKRWNRGQDVVLERNPDYASAPANAKHQGPAYVDGIDWKFLKEPTVRYGSLGSGQSDVVYDIPTVDWEDAKARYEVQQYITPGTPVRLALNTVRGPFADADVRRAFGYATDRRSAVESAFAGVIPYNGNGALSQSTPGYDASLADAYPHDQARASRLLDAAGWTERNADGIRVKDGEPLHVTLAYPSGAIITSEGATLLQSIQQQAKEAGFDVELLPATQSEVFAGKFSTPQAYDAWPAYWTSPTAGVLYIVWRQNLAKRPNFNNGSFYNDPELEQTIAAANSTLDKGEQDALYARAQQIIVDQAAVLGLYTQTTSLAIDKHLRDVWLEDSQGEPVFSDAHFVR